MEGESRFSPPRVGSLGATVEGSGWNIPIYVVSTSCFCGSFFLHKGCMMLLQGAYGAATPLLMHDPSCLKFCKSCLKS